MMNPPAYKDHMAGLAMQMLLKQDMENNTKRPFHDIAVDAYAMADRMFDEKTRRVEELYKAMEQSNDKPESAPAV